MFRFDSGSVRVVNYIGNEIVLGAEVHDGKFTAHVRCKSLAHCLKITYELF